MAAPAQTAGDQDPARAVSVDLQNLSSIDLAGTVQRDQLGVEPVEPRSRQRIPEQIDSAPASENDEGRLRRGGEQRIEVGQPRSPHQPAATARGIAASVGQTAAQRLQPRQSAASTRASGLGSLRVDESDGAEGTNLDAASAAATVLLVDVDPIRCQLNGQIGLEVVRYGAVCARSWAPDKRYLDPRGRRRSRPERAARSPDERGRRRRDAS